MTRMSPTKRAVTMLWAAVQLAAPALAGIADGRATLDSASQPITHIEATTTESCPVVHSPDCGLCRFVTGSATTDASAPSIDWTITAAGPCVEAFIGGPIGTANALPFGRAPPV